MRFLLCVWFFVGGLVYAQAPALNYDLINNVPLAHVMRGGPVADASQTGFLKYVRDMNGRWKPGESKGLSDPRLFWSYKREVLEP